MSDITGWNERELTQLRSDIYSDLQDLWKDMKFLKEINKKCSGKQICIYPDIDDEDDLPTLARIVQDNKEAIIISLSGIEDKYCQDQDYLDYIERRIESYLSEQKKKPYLETEKTRYNIMFDKIKGRFKSNLP